MKWTSNTKYTRAETKAFVILKVANPQDPRKSQVQQSSFLSQPIHYLIGVPQCPRKATDLLL